MQSSGSHPGAWGSRSSKDREQQGSRSLHPSSGPPNSTLCTQENKTLYLSATVCLLSWKCSRGSVKESKGSQTHRMLDPGGPQKPGSLFLPTKAPARSAPAYHIPWQGQQTWLWATMWKQVEKGFRLLAGGQENPSSRETFCCWVKALLNSLGSI